MALIFMWSWVRHIYETIYGISNTSTASFESLSEKLRRTAGHGRSVRNVYYVKIHKTASSTMLTMLYGVARRHNLTIYPVSGEPYPGSMTNKPFKLPNMKHIFNIFGEHAILDWKTAQKHMAADTHYIATLRHPISQLRSLFVEFFIQLKDNGILRTPSESSALFLQDPERYG